MLLSQSFVDELRVPVRRAEVELYTDREARSAFVFLPADREPEGIFEDDAPFFPAEEGGSIRLYARSAIVRIVVPKEMLVLSFEVTGVPYEERSITVHFRNGTELTGLLSSPSVRARTLDLLNSRTKSFALHAGGSVHYIAKAHVERIEEGP